MGALLHDVAVFKYEDLVGVPCRAGNINRDGGFSR
jgi:hypothetical protein